MISEGRVAGRTLHLEKNLAAPPERVFAACVEPEKLAEWWGPTGFTSPSLELDVRESGRYRITMQPPEGDAFHLRGEFREIEAPRRLVYTFVWEEPDPDDQETVVTLTFVREGGTPVSSLTRVHSRPRPDTSSTERVGRKRSNGSNGPLCKGERLVDDVRWDGGAFDHAPSVASPGNARKATQRPHQQRI